MTAVVFDTLKFVEKLEAAGVSHAQAKATAEAFAEATGQELVTKSDLAAAKAELKADIASTRAELREVELRMTVKLGGLIVGAVGVILAAIRYLPAGH
ncbi:hypothetical protein MSC49_06930 [Methylosinus sp. C49]|uniref:DUF1640 domain-containing protein n=1 Tax=unclassified Methylosinus TaxID=2624500 RepID=UPI00036DD4C1|nr:MULTISPECIES: DUF1640 domain-containing protein [unclassified Methylosinus]BBU60758.1 hypothetical protein MSC49_06930 [Methylosinus sp. C49]